LNWLAIILLNEVNWESLRTIVSDASMIPSAVEALSEALRPEEVEAAYWRLDNHVVVQGQIFDSALALIPVLLALLAGALAEPVRASILELLFQILVGTPDHTEIDRGLLNLAEECRTEIKKGMWLFYSDLFSTEPSVRKVAMELVVECDEDELRRGRVLEWLGASDPDDGIRRVARKIQAKVGLGPPPPP
jgi:hypothetical protein